MHRLQIYIDDEAHELLGMESQRLGRSKAWLIREAVRAQYGDARPDALDEWVGSVDGEPSDIDSVVYDG
jgi:predicted transcriptional regulator